MTLPGGPLTYLKLSELFQEYISLELTSELYSKTIRYFFWNQAKQIENCHKKLINFKRDGT